MAFRPYGPREKGFTSGDIERIFKKLKGMAQVGKGKKAYYEPILFDDWEMLGMFLDEYDEKHLRWSVRHLITDQKVVLVQKGDCYILEIIPF